MTTTTDEVLVDAPVDVVFTVLADAEAYAYWVVGSNVIRAVDRGWPAVGTRFHHSIGVGPVNVNDNSEVLEISPPRLVRLEVRLRPYLVAEVELRLEPVGEEQTRVVMSETPTGGWLAPASPLIAPLLSVRNKLSLQRLAKLAAGAPVPADTSG